MYIYLSYVLFLQEPEVYELEIMQPPTRDDWITDIREAVDAASPGKKNSSKNRVRINLIFRDKNALLIEYRGIGLGVPLSILDIQN